ncbi:MAG: CYTH domain-containing protein [Alphaproteobacteria bacterium]|nr:CYTH domain-containing protein [Alphaproteobacteria bacterium]
MSKSLEIESKSMLSKGDYKTLISAYKNIKKYKQINYYISSKEMMEKVKNYGLRIRQIGHFFELTLKVSEEVGKTEITQDIAGIFLTNLLYFGKFPDGEVKDYLVKNKVCDITKLQFIGMLKTIRKDIDFNGSKISIDKSKYNDTVDYEIECESSSPEKAEKDLKIFLEKYGISYQKSEHNKLARFLNTLN